MLTAYASHGDTKHIVLYPANPGECFTMAVEAFDLAERFQTPVFVLSDLDIAMNDWLCPRFTWDDEYRPDRGKVLTAAELEAMTQYFRYMDDDGDGIAARTLPGVHPRGAYFTRGSGHTKLGTYTEDADDYVEVMERIARKIDSAADAVPEPIVQRTPGARIGLVSLGSCDAAVREAVDLMREAGVPLDYMRIRGFPFSQRVEAFLLEHESTFVIEQNRDGQLRSLLLLGTRAPKERLKSIREYGGIPLSAQDVIRGVLNGGSPAIGLQGTATPVPDASRLSAAALAGAASDAPAAPDSRSTVA
jgi:2-oxoglutarate ferredoxin oxidoreductase subunit alpha